MKVRRNIPNFFTSLNLLAGCFGIVAIMEGNPRTATLLIIAGAVFDFFDGFFARILKAGSLFGKEFDSLADMITFGLLPSFLFYFLFMETSEGYYPYVSFLIALAAGLRLARFNISENQNDYFIGLPTPANAFLIVGLVNIYLGGWESFLYFFNDPNILAVTVLILAFLMNSRIQFISLKFTSSRWKGNQYRYIIVVAGILLILFLQLPGIFFAMSFYLVLSVYRHFLLLSRPSS
jgi:CDP-diacylglycerol--serine O-phosphatidyltransferase